MSAPLRSAGGTIRGWYDPNRERIHAMNRGGWTLCGRRPGADWYENTGFLPTGFNPAFAECLECERVLSGSAP